MYCLGLEGSANKLGVGITAEDGRILANKRVTYNAPTGQGFMPQEVAKHHRSKIVDLIKLALKESDLSVKDIKFIAYTRGPGMGGPLSAVALVARTLSLLLKIPLVPVNHCVAHIEMGRLATGISDPIVLYASGGNTQIVAFQNKRYRIFGEALDVAVGNCLDRFARDAGIPNDPAPGLNIEIAAKRHFVKYNAVSQIAPVLRDIPIAVKGMDISCSGLNSWLQNYLITSIFTLDKPLQQEQIDMLCYSLQEHLFSALVEIAERAAAHLGKSDFLCVGGVGCNTRLQEMLESMAAARGGTVGAMDERYCVDNGAMISWTGWLVFKSVGKVDDIGGIDQRWRTDQVEVTWR